MRIGVIGCGYVFDLYMSTWNRHPHLELAGVADVDLGRAKKVSDAYGLKMYASNDDLVEDPSIDVVANFTGIDSHYEVSKAALLAGKHVYSEKPLCPDLAQARELVRLAAERDLRLGCAPSNALSSSTQTLWRAVLDGAVGDVRLVYAELDDNPIYLMSPEGWRSKTGAPWPYRHEYEQGCTYEHVGYHLAPLCSIFGPVASVTAFSKCTIPDKTHLPLDPRDTPDFSVACLDFESGVVGRVTCSIAAPYDHRVRVIGSKGVLTVDTYRHYESPVYYEPFTKLGLNARKSVSVRRNTLLQGTFGVGGSPLRLVGSRQSGGRRQAGSLLQRLKRRELGEQDKVVGIAELADAIQAGRPAFPAPDLTLHLTELTVAIQNAGVDGSPYVLQTDFEPVRPQAETLQATLDYSGRPWIRFLNRVSGAAIDRMHKH
jgi:predicted dehydrogenase